MTRRQRHGLVPLLWRQFGSERGASVAIAGVVLVVSFLAAAAPRALEVMTGDELAGTVSSIPGPVRDLNGNLLSLPPLGQGQQGPVYDDPALDAGWGTFTSTLRQVREDVPLPARDLLGEPQFAVNTAPIATSGIPVVPFEPTGRILLLGDPLVKDRVTITEGEWAKPADPSLVANPENGETERADPPSIYEPGSTIPLEIVLSGATAERMLWEVGEERIIPIGPQGWIAVKVTGLFEAVDAADDYWQHTPTTLEADYFDDGNSRPVATGGAFVAPEGWVTVSQLIADTFTLRAQTRMWFPMDGSALTGSTAETVLGQLRAVTSKAIPVGESGDGLESPRARFSTGIVDALSTIIARSSATTSVLLMATAGPLGVSIAVMALAGRLVAERRRPTLALIAARGGSNAQLRSVLALEGLVLGLPMAVLGIIAAILLVPARAAPASYVLPALIGLAPAVLFAIAAAPGSLRQVRSDLGQRPRGRRRLIVELVAVLLAATSVTLLVSRGTQGSPTAGVDPLLVATPLLLSLAACVVVLRFYPLPLAAIERALRARRGVVGFVGAARALRDPVAGLAPVLAMVVAVSVAVFSGAMFATLTGGVDSAAESTVGGDLRARGPVFTDEQLEQVKESPGVRDAALLYNAGTYSIVIGRQATPVTVILADTTALAAVQQGLADAAPHLPALSEPGTGGSVPIVLSANLASELRAEIDEAGDQLTIDGEKVEIIGSSGRIAGADVPHDWVYADAAFAETITTGRFLPRLLITTFENGADAAAIAEAVETAAGTVVTVSTRAQAAEGIRSSAFVSGLQLALAGVLVLVGLLCAVAIVLVSTINTRSRSRLLAILRTMGLSRQQSTALVGWELAPTAITAFVGGSLLGVALPAIVLAGVDLRPFTGGAAQPALVVDPVITAAVLGVFALIVAGSSVVAALGSRNAHLATALRSGDE